MPRLNSLRDFNRAHSRWESSWIDGPPDDDLEFSSDDEYDYDDYYYDNYNYYDNRE
jgi:hypothetical protein